MQSGGVTVSCCIVLIYLLLGKKKLSCCYDIMNRTYWGISCIGIMFRKTKIQPENTHLLCKGKSHCMAELLFDQLRFSCFACVELDRDLQVWSNPNQSNRRSAIQWQLPLWSKWVFSDTTNCFKLDSFQLRSETRHLVTKPRIVNSMYNESFSRILTSQIGRFSTEILTG